jgi:hypothetical protein
LKGNKIDEFFCSNTREKISGRAFTKFAVHEIESFPVNAKNKKILIIAQQKLIQVCKSLSFFAYGANVLELELKWHCPTQ